MKTRILSVALGGAFALAAFGGTALADQGGVPNANSCQGRITSYVVTNFGGQSQKAIADFFGVKVGDLHQFLQNTICN